MGNNNFLDEFNITDEILLVMYLVYIYNYTVALS